MRSLLSFSAIIIITLTACSQFKTGSSGNTSQGGPTGPVTSCGSTATLSWTPPTTRTDGTALTNLAGFNIYYGNSPTGLAHELNVPNAALSTYVISNLPADTYFFAMTAYDSDALESDKTNTVELILANCAQAKLDLQTGQVNK